MFLNLADILMGIFCRYFFQAAPIWTEEAARFALVWMVLLGAAGAFLHGDQMSVDFVASRKDPWIRTLCFWLSLSVQCLVLGVLVWYGLQNVTSGWRMKTMALGLPKAVPLMAVPAGAGLYLAAVAAEHLRRLVKGGPKA